MYGDLGISKEVLEYGARIEAALEDRFTEIDGNAEYNQLKVIAAMQKNRVSDIHFSGTTGYGYNDLGRERLLHLRSRQRTSRRHDGVSMYLLRLMTLAVLQNFLWLQKWIFFHLRMMTG